MIPLVSDVVTYDDTHEQDTDTTLLTYTTLSDVTPSSSLDTVSVQVTTSPLATIAPHMSPPQVTRHSSRFTKPPSGLKDYVTCVMAPFSSIFCSFNIYNFGHYCLPPLPFSSIVLPTIKHVYLLDSMAKLQDLNSYAQASKDLVWVEFMNEELNALEKNHTLPS